METDTETREEPGTGSGGGGFISTEERDALIQKLLRWDWPHRAIAQALGIGQGTVGRVSAKAARKVA